jgi:aminoglycoside phosphotransferase (APT) family kinase protein
MAGLSVGQRDLSATRARLGQWFEHKFGERADIGEMRPANRAAGWSSESLIFSATTPGGTTEFVARIPPTGGGIYADYDLAGQTRTQQLLHDYGIATPSPIHYEPDSSWLGSSFLVMPRIVGHTPSDTSYAVRGWLHGAGFDVQRRVHDSFLDTLVALQRVPIDKAPWLGRPNGVGNDGELAWWREYIEWATDKQVPPFMAEAFDWLYRHQPSEPTELTVCWGDARLSNTIFDDTGEIVGSWTGNRRVCARPRPTLPGGWPPAGRRWRSTGSTPTPSCPASTAESRSSTDTRR